MKQNYLQWLAASTGTVWWHDSADPAAAAAAIKNGATGMTTNPFLIASTLCDSSAGWRDIIGDWSALGGDEKALELEMRVGAHHAAIFRQFWGSGKRGEGGVCVQVDPSKPGNTEIMLAQVKKIGPFAPNICVKTPATHAGLSAFEEGIALGFNMTSTLSFSVAQCVAAAEAYERGAARARTKGIVPGLGVAVLMVGRLDDYIRDVASDGALDIPESTIIQAGIACMKKAYHIFKDRGYASMLMSAAGRGAYHVTELAGANIIMSTAPSIERAVLAADPERREKIDLPIDASVLEQLLSLREFQKAYDEKGMGIEDFITYGPLNRTMTQFTEKGWKPLLTC